MPRTARRTYSCTVKKYTQGSDDSKIARTLARQRVRLLLLIKAPQLFFSLSFFSLSAVLAASLSLRSFS